MAQSKMSVSIATIGPKGKFQNIKQADWTPEVVKGAKSFSVFSTDLTPEGEAEQKAYFESMVKHFSWPTECPLTGETLVHTSVIADTEFVKGEFREDGSPVTRTALNADGTPRMKRVIQCSVANKANSANVLRALMAKA